MATLRIAKDLFDLLYPIGTYYETSNTNWTPSGAGWYGTWVEDTAGKTTVAKDNGTFKTLGASVGSESVVLTKGQLPNYTLYNADHGHNLGWSGGYEHLYITSGKNTIFHGMATGSSTAYGIGGTYDNSGATNITVNSGGNNEAHNNIQPSIVVRRWHRTA